MAVTVQQIRKAMADLATIIETAPEGEKYWPWFERLERKLALREGRKERLEAARVAHLENLHR